MLRRRIHTEAGARAIGDFIFQGPMALSIWRRPAGRKLGVSQPVLQRFGIFIADDQTGLRQFS
jgi:hypothetical protein